MRFSAVSIPRLTVFSFIHGGAWRDPEIDHQSFTPPALNHLASSDRLSRDLIAGFASIDYRLSPHPDYPQDPLSTPSTELRDAQHPDHVHDVESALNFLRQEHGLKDDNYVLVGHSAGATLAFQLLMGSSTRAHAPSNPPLPAAIIGVSGIYDLVALDNRHQGNYAGFITSAFGDNREVWEAASPAAYTGSFKTSWPCSKFAILAWSQQDTLIDEPEIDAMAGKLIADRVNVFITKDLTGEHDDVWKQGSQLAQLVLQSLAQLEASS